MSQALLFFPCVLLSSGCGKLMLVEDAYERYAVHNTPQADMYKTWTEVGW